MPRHIKRKKASLPVDVRRSKTSLLKLPNILEKSGILGGKKQRNYLWDYLGEWIDRGAGSSDGQDQ